MLTLMYFSLLEAGDKNGALALKTKSIETLIEAYKLDKRHLVSFVLKKYVFLKNW